MAQDFSSKDIMTQQVSNATVTVQSLENDSTDAWLKPSCLVFILPSSSGSESKSIGQHLQEQDSKAGSGPT